MRYTVQEETINTYCMKKGFTLIELLVVIAIIGILSSVILASLNSARTKAQDTQRIASVKAFKTALELYYDDNGGYPTSNGSHNGDVLLTDSVLAPKLVPKYLPEMPQVLIDEWFHYYGSGFTTGVSPSYDLLVTMSYGRCRAGIMPEATGHWATPTVCGF